MRDLWKIYAKLPSVDKFNTFGIFVLSIAFLVVGRSGNLNYLEALGFVMALMTMVTGLLYLNSCALSRLGKESLDSSSIARAEAIQHLKEAIEHREKAAAMLKRSQEMLESWTSLVAAD